MSETPNIDLCTEWWKNHKVNPHYLGDGEPQVLKILDNFEDNGHWMYIMEYGCGAGRNLSLIQTRYGINTIAGYDFNPNMIKAAKNRIHVPLSTNREDIAEYGMFDLIFTLSVLDHVPDPDEHIQWMIKHAHNVAFIEPWVGQAQSIYPSHCNEPFSWSWNYDWILKDYNVIHKYHSPIITGELKDYYWTWIVKC